MRVHLAVSVAELALLSYLWKATMGELKKTMTTTKKTEKEHWWGCVVGLRVLCAESAAER